MKLSIASAPFIRPTMQVSWVMRQVLLALVPAILINTLFFGPGVILNILLACLVAVSCEAIALKLRDRPIVATLNDSSALLAGVLLGLAMPPLSPWWLTALGAAFALIVAKHLYGGLGYNPFNPAMAGYAALLTSFPSLMKQWPTPGAELPGVGDTLHHFIFGRLMDNRLIDLISSATVLDHTKSQLALHYTWSELSGETLYGMLGGAGWQWVALAYLAGGLYLLAVRIIDWRIPTTVLAALATLALFFHLVDSDHYPGPIFHLFSGAAMIGAFFIATDPVSAATTPKGRLIYGASIGILIYLIRTFGGYPDGVAFAVLILNAAVPVIDRHTQPRVYGHDRN